MVKALLDSEEPSIRWKVRTQVLGEDPASPASRRLGEEIRNSPRVHALIDGAATASYRKWQGRHWVLQTLAELGYPAGDEALEPLAETVLATWVNERYYREYEPTTGPRKPGVPVIDGRARRCGSQQGGACSPWPNSVSAATVRTAWSSDCCTGSGRTAGGTVTSSPRR